MRKTQGVKLWKMTISAKQYKEAENEVKFILWEK